MGRLHLRYFEQKVYYTCKDCGTQITHPELVESRVGLVR